MGRDASTDVKGSSRLPRIAGGVGDAPALVLLFVLLGLASFAVPASPQTADRRELVELRTTHSKTFANADGSRTTTVSLEPIHYRRADGRMVAISNRLVPHGAASVINEANAFRAAFDTTVGPEFVRVEHGGQRFGLTLEGAQGASGSVDGTKIRYDEVAAHTSLEYESRPTGIKETLILHSADAPSSFRFRLTQPAGSDLRASRRGDGSWALRQAGRGFAGIVIDAPWAVDAAGRGRRTAGAELEVTRDGDELVLDLSLDPQWVSDPERAFPVRLDPSINFGLPSDYAAFDAWCSSCPGYSYYDLRIGTTAQEAWRTALQFDLAGVPADAHITDAHVSLYTDGDCLTGTTGCAGSDHTIDAHQLTAGWDSGSLSGEIAFEAAPIDSDTLFAQSAPQALEWDITSLAREWQRGSSPNFGVLLKRASEPQGAGGISPLYMDADMDLTYVLDELTLFEPKVLNRTGATLRWSRYGGTGFDGYEVHRGDSAGYAPSASTRLATIASVDETTFRDDSARPGSTVYYKVVAAGRTSNAQRAQLPAETEPARSVLRMDSARGQATGIVDVVPGNGACTNQAHDPTFRASYNSRGLLRWDLRDIPAESRVNSAKVLLWRGQRTDAPSSFELAPVSSEWRESSRADCLGDGASWQEAQAGVRWSAPGGDTDAGAVTSSVVAGVAPGWQEWDVTAVVQEWIAGQRTNDGLLLRRTSGDDMWFYSDDHASSLAQHPTLEIVYEDPAPVGEPTVKVISPRDGQRVRETITIEAAAGDDRRVERVEFLLDGVEFDEDAQAPYSANFDTRAEQNGMHTVRARAVDDAGNTASSAAAEVEFANYDPPAVELARPAASYAEAVKADDPAAYWRLGETSGGTAEDASGYGRDGTYSGSYTRGLDGLIANDDDTSVRLNAGYGKVLASGFDSQLATVSVEAWVQHPGFSSPADTQIVSRSFSSVGGWALGVRRISPGYQQAYFAVRTSSGVVYASRLINPSATNPPTYHLVGTFDGTDAGLYVDGTRSGEMYAATSPTSAGTIVIGNSTAADLRVDEVAVYEGVLSSDKVKVHYELGRGGAYPVSGQVELAAEASAASARTLRSVEFLVDGQVLAADDTAPYTASWDTLAAGAVVPDGTHAVIARATDDHDRVTASTPVAVSVRNNTVSYQQAQLTAASALPGSLVHEPGASSQAQVPVDVRVKNVGGSPIYASNAVLRYRWRLPDGSFDDSLSGDYQLGGNLAPGDERIVTVSVSPPALPAGVERSRVTLRFDLRDTGSGQAWWASRGNPPLDHSVLVQRAGEVGLGLERYYHYDGEALGGGMSHLANLASGNSIVRFTPFASPGRGLSTVVDLTYNSKAGGTSKPGPGGPKPQQLRGSPLGPAWLLSVSSLSPLGEPLRCASPPNSALHPHKCEDYATKESPDLADIVMELTDADGTVHRFTGKRVNGHTTWREPQGAHLYLRELEPEERPACDIADGDPSKLMWAFTRPDGVTFYYEKNGWPTGTADRNGNCIDLVVEDPGNDKRLRVTKVIDAAGVADPALRSRRTFTLSYYDGQPGPGHGSGNYPQLASITDHTGSRLTFEYWNDDLLRTITQHGGTTTEGLSAPSRSWRFRWTGEHDYAGPNPREDKNNPKNSHRLYSVTDPRGHATTFGYVPEGNGTPKDVGKLAWRKDRANAQTSYGYDETTRTTTVDLPESRQSRYEFDVEGSVVKIVDKVSATREQTTQVAWTADRHVFKVTEPTGAFTEFAYNDNGYLTKRWDQLRRLTELRYENLPVDDDDVSANWRTGRGIEHISQLTKRITPRGHEWLFDHDDQTGNLLGVTDPEGFASRYSYNPDGTLAQARDGLRDDGTGTYVTPAGEPVRTTAYNGYDANGLPTEIVDAEGGRTRFCHDDDGLLRWVQDPNHASGALPTDWSRCFEHPGRGHRLYFDYDPLHRMVRQSAPKSTEHAPGTLIWSHVRFDRNDNVTDSFGPVYGPEFRDGAGTRTRFVYDVMDRVTDETLFDFNTRLRNGSLESVEREETTELVYDDAGRLEQLTTPRGVATVDAGDFATTYEYDLVDRVLVIRRHGKVGEDVRRRFYCYDEAGDLRSVTKPRDAQTPDMACALNGAPGETDYTKRFEYTTAHELRKIIDPEGHQSTQTYDADGNPWVFTDGDGAKTTRTYDGRGLLVQTVEDFETGASPRPVTTKIAYDAVGNPEHIYSPRAVEAAGGNPAPSSDFVRTIEYDALDRPVRIVLPKQGSEAQRYIHRRYDPNSNLTHTTVPVTTASLDAILADPAETEKWITRYTHFDPGWIRSSDDQAPEVQFDYSPEGWQIERFPQLPASPDRRTTWDHYRDGQLMTHSDANGNPVHFRYDHNGNLTYLKDAGVSSDRDPITLDIDYNGFDQVAVTTSSEQGRHTKITEYTYLDDGLVATRAEDREQDAGGTDVRAARSHEFRYDKDGLLIKQLDWGRDSGPADDKRIRFDYSPTHQETERLVDHWTGDVATGSYQPRQTVQKEYYANGLPWKLRTYGGAADPGNLRESHTVSYRDPAGTFVNGNRTRDEFFRKSPDAGVPCQSPANSCTQRWRYDGADRLDQERLTEPGGYSRQTGYRLTAAGGILEKFDADNPQLVQFSADFDGPRMTSYAVGSDTVEVHYDGDGNVDCTTTPAGTRGDCSKPLDVDPSAELLEDFTHDYRQRLVAHRKGDDTLIRYDHDALDRAYRERRKVGTTTTTTELSYIGATRLLAHEEEAGASSKTRSYLYDGLGRRIGMTYDGGQGSPQDLTYGHDPQGNVSLLLDDAGQAKASYGYRPYGETDQALTAEVLPNGQPADGQSPLNSFRYSSRRTDPLSGSIDMGARRFGPNLHSFLQRDQYQSALGDLGLATDALTANRYSLAAGNPISFVESDGHKPIDCKYCTADGSIPQDKRDDEARHQEQQAQLQAPWEQWYGSADYQQQASDAGQRALAREESYQQPRSPTPISGVPGCGPGSGSGCNLDALMPATPQMSLEQELDQIVSAARQVVDTAYRTLRYCNGLTQFNESLCPSSAERQQAAVTVASLYRGRARGAAAARPATGFGEGLGKTALTAERLQHGTKNLTKAGILPKWSGTKSPGIIRQALTPILERPQATFDHTLGGTRVRGFLGDINGNRVAVFVYKEGPYQGQLASSFRPSTHQLKMWGLGP